MIDDCHGVKIDVGLMVAEINIKTKSVIGVSLTIIFTDFQVFRSPKTAVVQGIIILQKYCYGHIKELPGPQGGCEGRA